MMYRQQFIHLFISANCITNFSFKIDQNKNNILLYIILYLPGVLGPGVGFGVTPLNTKKKKKKQHSTKVKCSRH